MFALYTVLFVVILVSWHVPIDWY